MKFNLPYNKNLKLNARELRKNSTLSEVLLWNKLKARQVFGLDFCRQKVIGNYIVDFYCPYMGLVIEIDGHSHDGKKYEYDIKRQKYLESFGLSVIRFTDLEIKREMDKVLYSLEYFIKNKMGQN